MPRLEPGTSCITLMHANPYTIPADLKKTVKFTNKYISKFCAFYAQNSYCGKSTDNHFWTPHNLN